MLELMVAPASSRPAVKNSLREWSCCAHPPKAISHPGQLSDTPATWLPANSPCTVASVLQANGQWSCDEPAEIDAQDWWFRTTFHAAEQPVSQPAFLCFDGLATLADVWLNGELLLTTDNMFRAYRVDVTGRLQSENELAICFRSLDADLQQKRSRPRWKTNLVNHQQLRWRRTSLQGRIPGWSPVAPAIGPWREIRLESSPCSLHDLQLRSHVDGTTGIVTVRAQVMGAARLEKAFLRVATQEVELQLESDIQGTWLSGEVHIENPELWWPHTHGTPSLHACELTLQIESTAERYVAVSQAIGFRRLETHVSGGFDIHVNDVSVYCRGACWTVSDQLTLSGSEESLRHDLQLARDAGVNMLRVGGTMVYESDRFYQLCDELGILVWQDFMFANMDYPVEDEAFHENVRQEAAQQLTRLAAHPCVAVYCGNSEIEQQAAMLGMPREVWRNDWFAKHLPALCAKYHPDAAYVPSTPSGGILPFHANTGVTHYYGIGAYLRSPLELRKADVKFTSECLGFANIPEPQTVDLITAGANPVIHHPKWKRRVPRDTGAGWDFEDVRDHYLRELYDVDPVQLRSWDMPRYMQLGRTVPGEMMSQAFSEWRSAYSHNQGGLVWFYKDLWPAAGWGVVDSTGTPKASYYYLKRTWSNRQLALTDEGLNGLHLHLINELPAPCRGRVEVTLLKEPNVIVAKKEVGVELGGHSRQTLQADEILGGFYDVTYAYRFGPPHHDVVVVTWFDERHEVISDAYHLIRRRDPSPANVALDATATQIGQHEYRVTLQTDCFLHAVRFSAKGFLPSDNYFYLPPERSKTVNFRPHGTPPAKFKVDVEALNIATPIRVSVP